MAPLLLITLSLTLLLTPTTSLNTVDTVTPYIQPDGHEVRASLFVNQLAIMELVSQLKHGVGISTTSCQAVEENLVSISSTVNETSSTVLQLSQENTADSTSVREALAEVQQQQQQQTDLVTSLHNQHTAVEENLVSILSTVNETSSTVLQLSQENTADSTSVREAIAVVQQQQTDLVTSLHNQHTGVQHQLERVTSAMEGLQQQISQLQETTQPSLLTCPGEFFVLERQCLLVNREEKLSWTDARTWCRNKRGDLAIPQESPALVSLLKSFKIDENFWMGASDLATEGVFLDVSNKPINLGSSLWHVGEPSGSEDCFHLWHNNVHGWNDAHCTRHEYFICEHQPI
ncbi:C-type lectin domain family 4 member M-like isoform X1 [Homarus americanus]|uniref:C-type lectin domain family 4 member M-like isoform X1 n=1 Tax=Homarus americanus TaxID=6706 RepID=UPI001C496434|nr:C-type lectin domain family 4 member M-like isoform X1 [Homarus americanus]